MFAQLYPDASLDTLRERFTRSEDEVAEDGSRFDAVAYRSHLAQRVIAAQTVTEADFAALGEARAAAVRDVLIRQGTGAEEAAAIEPDRVRITGPAAVASAEDGQVVMEVGLATD